MLADKSFRNAVNAVGAIKSNRNQMLEMKTDQRIKWTLVFLEFPSAISCYKMYILSLSYF